MDDLSFEYGSVAIGELKVETEPHPSKKGRRCVKNLVIRDEPVDDSDRFWTSLCVRFSEYGVNKQLFNLYDHAEVFERLTDRVPNDRLRYTIERRGLHAPRALAVTSPDKPAISYESLLDILTRFGGERVTYSDGLVNSVHTPRVACARFPVPCPRGQEDPHDFFNRYMLEVPIDGYGKPVVFPSLERADDGVLFVTRNASALKSELSIGKGLDVVNHAVCRVLDGFNTDEGYATLRNRIETARNSWASVYEANTAYKALSKLVGSSDVAGRVVPGVDGGDDKVNRALSGFHRTTGDTQAIYGLATLDALASKRQRNLPVACTIYSLMAFLASLATNDATERGRQALHGIVGGWMGSGEGYDLEGTCAKWRNFRDFRTHGDVADIGGITAVDE